MIRSKAEGANQSLAYRPDIDGLRAIAVSSVVLYHAWKDFLRGGYLGVDVFFVLSGFLITTILWKEMGAGSFSIQRFYERRIRRIMPALLLLVGVSSLVASLVLLPPDLLAFGRSALASLGFVANIYFWRDSNYFAPEAEQKPLLHIWSLGVEEQFYILFPILLWVLVRTWRRGVLPVVIVATIASLAANVLALRIGLPSPAFFLLPTRAWELGAGAILALMPLSFAPGGRLAGALALAGAGLLAVGLIHPFQGLTSIPVALPVVLGTSFLILAGRRVQSPINRLLSARPMVFLGLISYSLYLWHWPILVFSEYYLVRDLTVVEMFVAFAAMLGAAYLSWRYVERPFRGRSISAKRVVMTVAGSTVLVGAVAAVFVLQAGLPWRLNEKSAAINAAVGTNYRCPFSDYIIFGQLRACMMNLPTRSAQDADVVLVGNSHAQMYAPVWTEIIEAHGQQGLLVPLNGCLPTVTANISSQCLAAAQRNLTEIVKLPRAHTVIIGLTWWHEETPLVDEQGAVLDDRDHKALIATLDDLADRLQAGGKTVVLIGPIARADYDVASVVSRKLAYGRSVDDPIGYDQAQFLRRFDSVFRHFEQRSDIRFARPDLVQCSGGLCHYFFDGKSLFADSHHMAQAEVPRFRAIFESALYGDTAAAGATSIRP